MSIGIVTCETLDCEIRALAGRYPAVSCVETMPWDLHIDPERLLAAVRDKVRELERRVDVVVLGYGRCQALDRLGDRFRVPVLRPRAEDCIGVLLGQDNYQAALDEEPGTWFLSPGWTRMGTDFVFRELQLNRVGRRDIDPLALARRMLEGFTRALYIEVAAVGSDAELRRKAGCIAADLNLRLEAAPGSLKMLQGVFDQAVALTRRGKKREYD
jgi:hypothetical protein